MKSFILILVLLAGCSDIMYENAGINNTDNSTIHISATIRAIWGNQRDVILQVNDFGTYTSHTVLDTLNGQGFSGLEITYKTTWGLDDIDIIVRYNIRGTGSAYSLVLDSSLINVMETEFTTPYQSTFQLIIQ